MTQRNQTSNHHAKSRSTGVQRRNTDHADVGAAGIRRRLARSPRVWKGSDGFGVDIILFRRRRAQDGTKRPDGYVPRNHKIVSIISLVFDCRASPKRSSRLVEANENFSSDHSRTCVNNP